MIPRLPVTRSLLLRLWQHVDLAHHNDRAMWAACTIATAGMLRLWNVVLEPRLGVHSCPRLVSARVIGDELHFTIPATKVERRPTPTTRVLVRIGGPACPVGAFEEYARHLPASWWREPERPLFCNEAGNPLTVDQFKSRHRRMLRLAGVDTTGTRGVSHRRGGATDATEDGVPTHVVMAAGRWATESVCRRYVDVQDHAGAHRIARSASAYRAQIAARTPVTAAPVKV